MISVARLEALAELIRAKINTKSFEAQRADHYEMCDPLAEYYSGQVAALTWVRCELQKIIGEQK